MRSYRMMFRENRLFSKRAAKLTTKTMISRSNAEAYARPCTSGKGVPIWKKTAKGKEATGSRIEWGMKSV